MKKYWKIRIDNNIKEKLEYLKADKNFIVDILDGISDFMMSANKSNYMFISYTKNGYLGDWGWGEIIDNDWYLDNCYQYCGEVNLRKDKLNKIYEVFLENKI